LFNVICKRLNKKVYSINQLSELSGIMPHTIRIWEQRYNLLTPDRTDTNIRRYDDSQLRKLLNVVTLINDGVKISKISSLTEKQINELIEKKIRDEQSSDFIAEALINQLFSSGLTFNETDFEKAFSSAILKFGVKETYIKIIYPMLVRAGYMWQNTSLVPCQEHFITNLIKRKLFTAIDALPAPSKSKRKWVLFLMENEYHEMGLLFAYYLLRSAGHSVVYLGSGVPHEDLTLTVKRFNPTDLLFFSVHKTPKNVIQNYLKKMEKDFKKTSIILSANPDNLKGLKHGSNVKLISTISEFESLH
jgi:DNA-binding transcriptional MerR regulator